MNKFVLHERAWTSTRQRLKRKHSFYKESQTLVETLTKLELNFTVFVAHSYIRNQRDKILKES